MPRAKGRKRKAPPGCYWRGATLWAKVIIGGVEHRDSLRTGNAEIAAARAQGWRERKIAEIRFGDSRKTYMTAFAEWSEHIAVNVAASTSKRYGVSLHQLEPWLKPLFLDEVDKSLVAAIVAGRREKGVSNATIRRDLVALSSLLAFHDRDENPALVWLKKLTERREPIVLPEPADIERVIGLAPGNLAHLIRAAWLTGCRQNELVIATLRDIDHERRQMTVVGKGSKRRTISLPEAAYEALRIVPPRLGCQVFFWHSNGAPYSNVAARFRVLVNRAQERAQAARREFRPFRFHDLRHRFAVDFLKAGGSIYTLSQHLGHGSVKVTEIYLAFLSPEEADLAKHGDARNRAHRSAV